MSNKILEGLIKEKDYNLKKLLFKIVKDFDLNVNEFMLLIYFMNQDCPILDVNDIHNVTFMEPKIILQSFKALSIKGLISTKVTPVKDKISETIDLTNVYRAMVSDINYDIKKKSEKNIFEVFEKEFGRTLSPMEYEIINGWLSNQLSEELILGALKEATYNGVSSLRYIDRILLEWSKKGFKNMNDVNNFLEKKDNQNKARNEEKVLFDYNWLEDDEWFI
mgnify:CR=1 FL=1